MESHTPATSERTRFTSGRQAGSLVLDLHTPAGHTRARKDRRLS